MGLFFYFLNIQHSCNNPLAVEAAAPTKSVLDRLSPRVPAIDSCWTYVNGSFDAFSEKESNPVNAIPAMSGRMDPLKSVTRSCRVNLPRVNGQEGTMICFGQKCREKMNRMEPLKCLTR